MQSEQSFFGALADVIENAAQFVVTVDARHWFPATGVIWSPDGVIVTTSHVVRTDEEITVTLPDGNSVEAELVGRDRGHDLAVLRIEAENLPTPSFGDVGGLRVGQGVLALGRPAGDIQASLGIISAIQDGPAADMLRQRTRGRVRGHSERFDREQPEARAEGARRHAMYKAKMMRSRQAGRRDQEEREIRIVRHQRGERVKEVVINGGGEIRAGMRHTLGRHIRPDVVMYPGFSGGPLVNSTGQVLGVNTSGLLRGTAVTVPADVVSATVETLLAHGHIRQGYLGIGSQPARLPAGVAEELGQTIGMLVNKVQPDSPAEAGGLMVGDILVAIDGEPVESMDGVFAALTSDRVGQPISMTIVRGGALQAITITIGERK
nr:trypsin-like peptidase domain-containing protein [Anaerolineae bacterium]